MNKFNLYKFIQNQSTATDKTELQHLIEFIDDCEIIGYVLPTQKIYLSLHGKKISKKRNLREKRFAKKIIKNPELQKNLSIRKK